MVSARHRIEVALMTLESLHLHICTPHYTASFDAASFPFLVQDLVKSVLSLCLSSSPVPDTLCLTPFYARPLRVRMPLPK